MSCRWVHSVGGCTLWVGAGGCLWSWRGSTSCRWGLGPSAYVLLAAFAMPLPPLPCACARTSTPGAADACPHASVCLLLCASAQVLRVDAQAKSLTLHQKLRIPQVGHALILGDMLHCLEQMLGNACTYGMHLCDAACSGIMTRTHAAGSTALSPAKGGRAWMGAMCAALSPAKGGRAWMGAMCVALSPAKGGYAWMGAMCAALSPAKGGRAWMGAMCAALSPAKGRYAWMGAMCVALSPAKGGYVWMGAMCVALSPAQGGRAWMGVMCVACSVSR